MKKQTLTNNKSEKRNEQQPLLQRQGYIVPSVNPNKRKSSSKHDRAMNGYAWNVILFLIAGFNFGAGENFFKALLIVSIGFLITEMNIIYDTRSSKAFHNFLLIWTSFDIFVCLLEASGILVASGKDYLASVGISDKFAVHITTSLNIGGVYCILCLPIIIGILGNLAYWHFTRR